MNNRNRLIVLATLDARARYALLLAEEPHLAERIPDHLLATYLNMTPETLSRTKRKWREEQAA